MQAAYMYVSKFSNVKIQHKMHLRHKRGGGTNFPYDGSWTPAVRELVVL